jgi:tetratricopeptide (TPR) repeat protein
MSPVGSGAAGDISERLDRVRALRSQGRLDEALLAANHLVETAPEHAGAWFGLGAVLDDKGDLTGAIEAYRKALEIDPAHARAWSNYGAVLGIQGDRAGEIAAYRRAVAADPRLAPVWSNLGNALREARAFNEAIAACRRATEIDPAMAAAWSNLGSALHDAGCFGASVVASRSALQLDPQLADAWNNIAGALRSLNRYGEAIDAHEHAARLRPDSASFCFNFGITLQHAGRTERAIAQLRRALAIDPGDAEVHTELSLALLGSGRLAEGWQEYEWRWRRPAAQAKRHAGPDWDGDRSRPRKLLLWSEQGVGDQILYAALIPELARSPLRLAAEMDPRLVALFRRSFPSISVVPRHEPSHVAPRDYDCQAPLASLGRWLRPSLNSFPRHEGYLKADARRGTELRSRLRALGTGPRVGISWSSANREFGDRKSTALAAWTPLLRTPGLSFVDLQYGDTARERARIERLLEIRVIHLDDVDLYGDLDGLAALCAACDLVITVSNVTAHVAGALGKPVWLLAPRARGRLWYWFDGRKDSPWYPSMRIYSQHTLGDWQGVFEEIARDLASWSADAPPDRDSPTAGTNPGEKT